MKRNHGYTLIEVLIASAILLMGIAAAAQIALTIGVQEEGNVRTARAINLQEQAARLYQLGVSTSTIASILPPETNVVSISFTSSSSNVVNAGTVEIADCTMVFVSGKPISDTSSALAAQRTNQLRLVRPSIR